MGIPVSQITGASTVFNGLEFEFEFEFEFV